MADKEAEKDKDKDKDKDKEESPKDSNVKLTKKNKIILFAGIGGVLLLVILIGGFIAFKTMSAKKQAEFEISQEGGPGEIPAAEQPPGEADKSKEPEKKDEHKKDEKKDEHNNKDEKKDEHKKDEHNKDAKKEEGKGTANFGDTYAVTKMDLNLGNPIENRYLRIAVAIEYRGGEEQLSEIKKRDIQIKDIIITTVTNKTRQQLLTENGKELLRREILNKINEVSDKPVQNIFFTEFLVE